MDCIKMVVTMNPCPCGHYPDMNRCHCTTREVSHYLGKISQPLLDRIDLCTEVPAVTFSQINERNTGECSAGIRKRVEKTREFQRLRYEKQEFCFNGELSGKQIEKYCTMTAEAKRLLSRAFEKMSFSARAYHRILKVARTIADMEEEENIHSGHMGEALTYRAFDKKYWN